MTAAEFKTAFIVGLQLGIDLPIGIECPDRQREVAEAAYSEWQAFQSAQPVDPQAWADERRWVDTAAYDSRSWASASARPQRGQDTLDDTLVGNPPLSRRSA